jgi:hypothetical protein
VEPSDFLLPSEYYPEGMNKLYHVSYFYVSLIGFLITLVLGLLISLCTATEYPDPATLSKFARKRMEKSRPTAASSPLFSQPKTDLNGVKVATNEKVDLNS